MNGDEKLVQEIKSDAKTSDSEIDIGGVEIILNKDEETVENTSVDDNSQEFKKDPDEEFYGKNLRKLVDFAEECGVSYETIRRKVAKNEKQLGNHIVRDSVTGTRYLDEYAQEFLRKKTATHFVQLADKTALDEAKMWHDRFLELNMKYTELLERNTELSEKTARLLIFEEKEKTYQLQLEKSKQLEEEIADREKQQEQLENKARELESQLEDLKAENSSYVPYKTLFGKTRYKKVDK